jgi:squalene synthase HpnC
MRKAPISQPSDQLAGIRAPETVRAAENFPVALRVLPTTVRRHLYALYGYARFIDDLGDEPMPGMRVEDRLAALDRVESELRGLYAGQPVTLPVLRALAPTIAARQLPMEPLIQLIEANRVDQSVTRYGTFEELTRYCASSANPVGELVLHVFGRPRPVQVALSDRICTALQIIEHLQDIREDRRRGRIYLPKADLDRFGVAEDDLDAPTASPALRNLIGFQAERARAWLETGAPLVSTLRGWARLSVSGYLAGGRAALVALARSGYDPLRARPKPTRWQVLAQWLVATIRSAG